MNMIAPECDEITEMENEGLEKVKRKLIGEVEVQFVWVAGPIQIQSVSELFP